jgi:CCR4-NOT transcription complex subunit 4
MDRSQSKDESDHGDGSALPSSASWAKGGQQLSRRGSLATSAAASSPAISVALPASVQEEVSHQDSRSESVSEVAPASPVQTAPSQQPARPKDPILADILKAISYLSTLKDSAPKDTAERTRKYLPLFDDNGGRKRRAIREQQEAARLQLAQEMEQSTAAASETAEEQEPASGSGQLGGEPEDRVESRQGSTPGLLDDRRRSSSQLPIHRASQDNAVFGGAQAISPNPTTNGLTVNGRALTPLQQQQLLLLKSSQPQSASFIPDYPPGIGDIASQSNLMQPGHNRQASRYNFANDAAKVGAGSNQQSPMLGLPSNQFYGTTVAGPPPGLKSTGTPPNAMFGQSQFGAPGFGGVRKENSNEILQMLRSGGNSEAAKRELMFPFSNQYPSASIPAPASNLLASLYSAQPGAFQDFGPKQKKKGKKQRHANTSSSGGSGLVDLADPTLLQARMQSQQQSSTGAGQGLFGGGQTQGGYNQSMMYGAAFRNGGW